MNETDQKEFVQLIAYLTGAKSGSDLEKSIKDLGEEGLKTLAEQYKQLKASANEVEQKQIMESMKNTCDSILNRGTKVAKLGAKLNYIQALGNRCPEGTRAYKVGGNVECKKCGGSASKINVKKRFQDGGEFFENADVNIPYGIYHPVKEPNPSLRIHIPYDGETYSSQTDIIEFDKKSNLPIHPKTVTRHIHSTPLNSDTFYVVEPDVWTTRKLENKYGKIMFDKAVKELSKNKNK